MTANCLKKIEGIVRGLCLLAALAVVLISLTPIAARAQEMTALDMYVTYVDAQGQEFMAYPELVDEGANAYWAYVPSESLSSAVLHVHDMNGYAVTFQPGDGSVLAAQNAGSALGGPATEIVGYTADGGTAVSLRLYLSTESALPLEDGPDNGLDMPDVPEPTPDPIAEGPWPTEEALPTPEEITIVVHYQTASGEQVAEDTYLTAWTGEMAVVNAEPAFLPEEARLNGSPQQYIDLPLGTVGVQEVTFLYTLPEPTPVPADAAVVIHYRDIGGAELASDQVILCPGGKTTDVYAAPEDLPEHYYLIGEGVQQVLVGIEGAIPDELTFYYEYRAPQTPAPATLVIHYVSEAGDKLAADGLMTGTPGETVTVTAAPEQIPDNYELID